MLERSTSLAPHPSSLHSGHRNIAVLDPGISRDFLRELGRWVRGESGDANVLQRITMAVQRGNAAVIWQASRPINSTIANIITSNFKLIIIIIITIANNNNNK